MTEQLRQRLASHDHGWAHRQLVLACTLSLLGLLLFIVTAHAYVAKVTKTTLVDFDGGSFFYTALLDLPPDIDSVQLMPIGLTGEMELSAHPLPVRLANAGAVGHHDFLYVIGGTDNDQTIRGEVYSSQTSMGGEVTPWQSQTPLPAGRAGAGMAVYPLDVEHSVFYVVGGRQPNYQPADTVYRAMVNNDTGQIGTWEIDDEHLLFPLYYASTVQHAGALYVIGGVSSFAFNRVDYATINADGSLSPFTETVPLPEPLYSSVAIVYEGVTTDTLYVIGGRNQYTSTFKVYFADFLPEGGLTSWKLSKGNLPLHIYGHNGVYFNGEIILAGGVVNAVDPVDGISNTVKAALVDPSNPSFRLYDWCQGVPPPACTIGAWQTGGLLPEPRSLHGMAEAHGNIYVLGGQDGTLKVRNSVYYVSIDGSSALYAPQGEYLSYEVDLGQDAALRRLTWGATLSDPDAMGIGMQYRYRPLSGSWSTWSTPQLSIHGVNQSDIDPPIENVRFVQYRATLTTAVSTTSPLLDWVEIYYEVADPELAVRKDTNDISEVPLQGYLDYTIYYTNSGQWTARDVVVSETLPAYTVYGGGSDWHRVGSSDVYTYLVGDLGRGANGEASFRIQVESSVPEGTKSITNHVEIDYPPLIDAFGQAVIDPIPHNNSFDWSTSLSLFAMTISKEAYPPTSVMVQPGSTISYTIRYGNSGTRAVSQAILTDVFDLEGDYTVVSANPPPDRNGNVWDLGTLAGGQNGQIEIVVQLNQPMPNSWTVTNKASIASLEGDPLHTPVLTHTVLNLDGTEPASMVDLVMEGMTWESVHSQTTSGFSFYATVTNQGEADATEPFWAALYIKPQPSHPPESPSDHDRGYCLYDCTTLRDHYVAYVAELAAGASTAVAFEALEPDPDFPAAGCYDVYLQADVAFDSPEYSFYWGLYAEDDETNNILHETICIEEGPVNDGPPRVFLPIVSRLGY
jgi:uncharacterized repeat protein (TIGR01451 family)